MGKLSRPLLPGLPALTEWGSGTNGGKENWQIEESRSETFDIVRSRVTWRHLRKEVMPVTRIDGVDPDRAEKQIKAVLEAQAKKWGAPLANHLLYARRPTVFRGVRGMWSGLDASGLIDPKLVALVNRRVAALNDCVF